MKFITDFNKLEEMQSSPDELDLCKSLIVLNTSFSETGSRNMVG